MILLDLSGDQARLLNLALNKHLRLLGRGAAGSPTCRAGCNAPEVDLSLSGFDDDEVSKLLKSLDARDKRERIEHFDPDCRPERRTGQPPRPTWRPVVPRRPQAAMRRFDRRARCGAVVCVPRSRPF